MYCSLAPSDKPVNYQKWCNTCKNCYILYHGMDAIIAMNYVIYSCCHNCYQHLIKSKSDCVCGYRHEIEHLCHIPIKNKYMNINVL